MQKMQECCHLFFWVVDHDDEVDWGVKNVFRLSDSPFKPPDEHLPKSKSLTVLLLMIIALWPPLLVLVDILFPSNHNINKSSYGLCFWAPDPLIERFY